MKTYHFIMLVIFLALIFDWLMPFDSTDDAENNHCSGMTLLTDYMTGCQYLKSGFIIGTLTPRLDGDGRHVGCN